MVAKLPFEPLRAFVYAARASSFRGAAERLNLTPGALSQRIAALEAHLGTPLFARSAQGVELLPAGERLLAKVSGPLDAIEDILRPPAQRDLLRLHTVASFANFWLIPRLGTFRERHPAIEIAIESSARLADLSSGSVHADLAIRYGKGVYAGLAAHELLRPSLALIVAPTLRAQAGEAASVAELLRRLPLLRDRNHEEWQLWLDRFQVPRAEASWGPALDDDAGMIGAVLAEQGVASVRDLYIAEHLAAGRLVRLASIAAPPEAFYLVGRRERLERRDARAFLRWLRAEASAEADAAEPA